MGIGPKYLRWILIGSRGTSCNNQCGEGGLLDGNSYYSKGYSYSVTVGTRGATTRGNENNGNNLQLTSLTAQGGGCVLYDKGANGGSAGGGGRYLCSGPTAGASEVIIIGYKTRYKQLSMSAGLTYTINTTSRTGYYVYTFTSETGTIQFN